MSTALLEAAKTLVEAERATMSASLAVREAHRRCDHSYGCCTSRACIDAENALAAAVRAEFQAQKEALAELRKLAEANATKDSPLRDKTVLFDGEFRPSAEWQELAAKATR